MGQLRKIEEPLEKLGYQVVALAPDLPEKLAESRGKHEFGYQLLSDAKMSAARAFGIAFALDEETVKLYKGYGIDLTAASGETHQELPVPAVFLIGTDGVIDFQYINPDYRVRLSAEVVLAAAEATHEHDAKAAAN